MMMMFHLDEKVMMMKTAVVIGDDEYDYARSYEFEVDD